MARFSTKKNEQLVRFYCRKEISPANCVANGDHKGYDKKGRQYVRRCFNKNALNREGAKNAKDARTGYLILCETLASSGAFVVNILLVKLCQADS